MATAKRKSEPLTSLIRPPQFRTWPGSIHPQEHRCIKWQLMSLKPPEKLASAVRAYLEEFNTRGRFIAMRCDASTKLKQIKSKRFFAA